MGTIFKFPIKNYGCNVYVETGTGTASCLQFAINSHVFKEFYSVDIEESFVQRAKKRFPFANLECGISIDVLEKWLQSIRLSDKVLFFLDAHFPGSDFFNKEYNVNDDNAVPLKEELKLIKKYRPNCNDYIICDDARIYKIDNFKSGNVPHLQVPGGMDFVYDIFPNRKITLDLSDHGYILIDNI